MSEARRYPAIVDDVDEESAFVRRTFTASVVLASDYDAALAEIERLKSALMFYGWHKADCPLFSEASWKPCTCGFHTALRGEEGK